MSDTVKCDGCNSIGKRQRWHPAPNDWFFIESLVEDDGNNHIIYVYACSEACKQNLWIKGPGKSFKEEVIKEQYNVCGHYGCKNSVKGKTLCDRCQEDYHEDPDAFK